MSYENPKTLNQIKQKLRKAGSKKKAKILQRFFKTGPGQYSQGDIFLGITVPIIKKVVKEHEDLSLKETCRLLRSPIHEERLTALLILVQQFEKSNQPKQKKIYNLYLKHTKYINNWDLVDLSASHIVGAFLKENNKNPLSILARSKSLWERRIAIVATYHFIKNQEFSQTLKISGILLKDKEDLIHKATGWMLREVGKRNQKAEEKFLKKHYKKMPRTMLRYAIERFPETKRQAYLLGKF
ncbi:MAG: DNA alkylation repair protein [Candidatus Omnitrophica bacterium]|nr:DNA alkylation repair protein [Candidatus Omnitrophota bacterium]